jgi:hypothetical protein
MTMQEKVVARFRDGRIVKGTVRDFRADADVIMLDEDGSGEEHRISIADLKAIFFVKTFCGRSEYIERKVFGMRKLKGRKALVKFDDKETMVGYIDGEVPWNKGFSLETSGKKTHGFFLTPTDGDCNNDRVFVVGDAIQDITIMMV